MRTSSRIHQLLAASVTILLLATPVLAGSGKGPTARQGSGKGTQDRLRDGSCRDAIEQQGGDQRLAGDLLRTLLRDQLRDPDQDRLRDGSCQDGIEQKDGDQRLAGDLLRTLLRDQLRDPDQDRLQDGSCMEG